MEKLNKDVFTAEERRALEVSINAIEKTYGAGNVFLGNETVPCEIIPTGNMLLDIATVVGGFPRGKVVEVYGPAQAGKTTLALHAIEQAQKMGLRCLFIDAEHALDLPYAKKLEVDLDSLIISQPDFGEEALDIAESMIRSGVIKLVVIDSVAALVPKAELEGEMGEFKIGLQARLMSQALRKLIAVTHEQNATIIFINQIRMKIGGYGNPEETTGGGALKYYSSMRFDCRQTGKIKKDEEVLGITSKITVVKNKFARPYNSAEFDIIFGLGHDRLGLLIDAAVGFNIIDLKGAWYSYKGEKIGQGKAQARELLQGNEKLREEIELAVRNCINPKE